jgi:hypothetical protein
MTNYVCLIQSNFVTEIIVADFDWVLENLEGTWINLFENTDFIGIGYSYNSATNTFNPPPNRNAES